ncbi:sigma-70 family RNA polymerase sigma factor [Actinomadura darangshiensis]|uniref:Sigma-70 family RNA polymerase sigma factor n=1 Tax=Actinomadura darangshiensis TaxID=705336 RepID=A0A4R5B4L4_9ACTN|nr:RNA polymerase sigma factor SigJ [Actinomadura darangshiensis]TDD81168.1 sigma-70 family RNA polymerase sigma factor [Actinomadura darangshiensis]
MTDRDTEELLARHFEANRPRLLRVAYTMTGSLVEAEDCVQEAWLRLRGLDDPAAIRELAAWLTTTVSRLALDVLSSARARREQYIGTWLPEPLVETGSPDPADRVTLDESVSMALLVVLELLSPAERTAFVLHDVFGVPFPEIAQVVGRTPGAVRQLASRARRHVEDGRPRTPATRAEQHELVQAFTAACQHGDLPALIALLDPDVVLRGDGGGKTNTLNHIERNAARVAPMMIGHSQTAGPMHILPAEVNGAPGLVVRSSDGGLAVLAFTVDAGLITAIDLIRNPDKLANVPNLG